MIDTAQALPESYERPPAVPDILATPSALSKTQQKKARRRLQAEIDTGMKTASSQATLLSDQAASVDTSNGTDDQADEEPRANPYCEGISKRLKYLKKKQSRVGRYEGLDRKTLNPDQLLMLEKKPELNMAISELEDLLASFATIEAQEARIAKDQQRKLQQAHAQALQQAIEDQKSVFAAHIQNTLKSFFVLNFLLPNLSASSIAINEQQYHTLTHFRCAVAAVNLEGAESCENFIDEAHAHLIKYLEGSNEEFVPGTSYADLAALISGILHPVSAPQFGVPEEDLAEAESSEASRDASLPQPLANLELTTKTNTISFLSPSECLEPALGEPVPADDLAEKSDFADTSSEEVAVLVDDTTGGFSVDVPEPASAPVSDETQPREVQPQGERTRNPRYRGKNYRPDFRSHRNRPQDEGRDKGSTDRSSRASQSQGQSQRPRGPGSATRRPNGDGAVQTPPGKSGRRGDHQRLDKTETRHPGGDRPRAGIQQPRDN
ncbi:uncharacterized protein BJ171DRAFT_126033 [Polychytrium aggregatum]|uniref:uncharacterized protein n=1 Tax=Polychytrium aggregatum TaxID=110093 RepID=UPI0022FE5599|nr:uncharacterized protein BJ171DRAFT_126033 [Polychytrium aggregatum]KAI9203931.1 hypothetical protein BJ171DRAFT_126033 [Polychytrium aggregatum]